MKTRSWLILPVLLLFALGALLLTGSPVGQTKTVRGKSPALPLSDKLSPEQSLAQDLALSDPEVQALTVGRRSEVFGVRDVLNQFTAPASACATADCRQVEIYNFDEDAAVLALVDVDSAQVLDVLYQPGVHPGINKRLADVALDIALNHPDVIAELGFRPSAVDMAPVDADLVNSSCDGRRLCAGPTFDLGDQILWVIVDLTDETLAGLYYTPSDPSGDSVLFTPEEGCPPGGVVTLDGWQMDYETTGSDGFRVYNVAYSGVEVATSIKTVEWHADYGSSGYRDSTGCSGSGGGFPIYPFGDTVQNDLFEGPTRVGFELVQDFRMSNWGNSCNYRYQQHMQFFTDGRFRVVTAAFGKGCGTNSLYRPVVRIDIAVNGDANDSYSRYDGLEFAAMTTEEYLVPYADGVHGPHEYNADGYIGMITDAGGSGYYIEPSRGQFNDNGRPEEPFVYITAHHASEGDTDLGVIGACCNNDHVQGPDAYVNGEAISDTNLTLWWVPQMDTDVTPGSYYCWTVTGDPNPETYPCFAGPMFVPIGDLPVSAGFTSNSPILLTDTAVFTNTTAGAGPFTFNWDFGDGSGSTDENPTHTYASGGQYTVSLAVNNGTSSDSASGAMDVIAAPIAAFTHDAAVTVDVPVNFANDTVGVAPMTYLWDFGDGATSTAENPSHTYTAGGTYQVKLTATNSYGMSMATSNINVAAAARAAFSHNCPCIPNATAQFTNHSTGSDPLTYLWEFGDGVTSTDENPTHVFDREGIFNVRLTAVNGLGSSSVTIQVVVSKTAFDETTYFPFTRR